MKIFLLSIIGALMAVFLYWVVGVAGGTKSEQVIGSFSGWILILQLHIMSKLETLNE